MRDAIDGYLRDYDPEAHLDDLWTRMRQSIEARGNGPEDVERTVDEVRRSRR
jgi:hypothetical protein